MIFTSTHFVEDLSMTASENNFSTGHKQISCRKVENMKHLYFPLFPEAYFETIRTSTMQPFLQKQLTAFNR